MLNSPGSQYQPSAEVRARLDEEIGKVQAELLTHLREGEGVSTLNAVRGFLGTVTSDQAVASRAFCNLLARGLLTYDHTHRVRLAA